MKINEKQLRKIIRTALLESVYNGFDFRKMQDDYSMYKRSNPTDPAWGEKPEFGYDVTSGGKVANGSENGSGEWEDYYPTELTDFWGDIISRAAHASGLDDRLAGKLSSRIEMSFNSDEEMEEFIGVLEQGQFQEAADYINMEGADAVEKSKDPNYWVAGADFEMEVTPEMLERFYEGFKKVYDEGQANDLFADEEY